MLALARGEGQSIIIDGNIEVKVVKWSRSSVRLAIQAPREVTVDRDEVWRKMHPGEATPLEKAEAERKERFAREGLSLGEMAVRASRDGTFQLAAGIVAGQTVEAGALLGTIEDPEGQNAEIRAMKRETLLRVVISTG
ncbi:MAG TPA: carbon storage regulator, partial [Phycisphaerae bacterium]|nr:carbon storage regulator [Phycisphaerae bacterium]